MSRSAGPFAAILVFLAMGPSGSAEVPAAGAFGAQTSLTVVEIPVEVIAGGDPVRGLTAANFELRDGGQVRPLRSFTALDTTAPPAEGAEPAARRRILLLFDLAFTDRSGLERAEKSARAWLRSGLAPTDLVGVALYSGRKGLVWPLNFTTDRGEVERVLNGVAGLAHGKAQVEDKAPGSSSGDLLRLTAGGWDAVPADIGSSTINDAQAAQDVLFESDSAVESTVFMWRDMNTANAQRRQAEARALLDALGGLAANTRSIVGAKHLVLFSNGFPANAFSARGGQGLSRTLGVMDELVTDLRRTGWRVHGVDLSRGAVNEGGGQGSLVYLARETGGVLVRNFDGSVDPLEQIAARTAVTYLLAFEAADLPADGAFRPIEVTLKDGPRGAKVLHREGYYAPRPWREEPVAARFASAAELLAAGVPRDELSAGALAVALRPGAAGEPRRAPVLVEVEGAGLLAEGAPDAAVTLEVYAYARDAGGEIFDHFFRSLSLDRGKTAETLREGGLKFVADLKLPPGAAEVRVLVRSAASGRSMLEVIPLPEEAPANPWLSLVFPQLRSESWLLTRETGSSADEVFRSNGQRFLPTVRPRVEQDGTRDLVLLCRDLPPAGLALEMRVWDAAGQPVTGGWQLAVRERVSNGEGNPEAVVLALSPGELPVGDYTLELAVPDEAGRGAARATAQGRFTVVAPP